MTIRDLEALRLSPLRVSPYPLWYSLCWPWYFRWPSVRNHSRAPRQPSRFARAGVGPAQRTLRICAIGDIMVMQGDRVPVLAPELVSLFMGADLIVGCCEAPLGRGACDDAAKHHFVFNMPADYLGAIIAQSGTAPNKWYLSVANNHAGDVGPNGVSTTVAHLDRLGAHGLGHRLTALPPVTVVQHRGLRIGLTAWTQWLNVREHRVWSASESLGLPWPKIKSEHGIDCLIGSAHWDFEWQHFPRIETRQLARQFADAGFNLILDSHTHTLQPVEWFDQTLCAYSLGNFCSGIGSAWPARMCTVLMLELATEGPHRGNVVRYELHQFVQIDDGTRVALVPLFSAPAVLRQRVAERVALVFSPPNHNG